MLDALFKPRSVAIIGASNNPLSIGHIVIQNLIDHGFKGPIFPINPKSAYIKCFKAYPSVLDIPDEVDLVNISIKNTLVPYAIEECGKKGVKFAIVHTAGFKEVGEEGLKLEKHMLEIAHKYGLRVYGPNSQGIQNSDESVSVYANFTFVPMMPGNISIVAQSGGVGEVLKLHLYEIGLGIRMYASFGNECDVSMNEIIEHYGEDEGTDVIMVHIETLKDPKGFLEIASKITKKKPILALKSGKTPEGAKAVSSHTGTLMEQDTTTDVIFKKSGVLRFQTEDDMIQAAIAFSTQPVPKGDRIAMITNTGGPGILAVDECIESGMTLSKLEKKTMDHLRKNLHKEATVINPVDVVATATPEHYDLAIQSLIDDPNVDSILINFITAPFVDLPGIGAKIASHAKTTTKPIVCVLMTIEKWGYLIDMIRKGGIPVYAFPETGAKVLVAMTKYGQIKHAKEAKTKTFKVSRDNVKKIIKSAKAGYLTQLDAFTILDAYGISMANFKGASKIEDLKKAAKMMNYPLVLKADSEKIIHKTEMGAIETSIENEKQLIEVFNKMNKKLSKLKPSYILQEELPKAKEVIIGVNNTEGFGPIIMFGLGGIFVEVLKDVQFRLAPLSENDILDMIQTIKGYPVLEGVRGEKGADIKGIVDVIQRISNLALDFPQIKEMDLNPVFCYGKGEGAKVVDVRIRIG
ncbi:acetate--CoA ligase family protein [bacterium]|nr:acetate--CoA ligase family protein [bacterium]